MCAPLIVGAVMAVAYMAKTTFDNKDAAKAEGQRADNARLQATEYVKANNYTQANAALANRDAFENAVQQMTAKNMQGIQNLGAIDTSIAESGLSGNSMNRLRRSVEASTDAEQMNIKNTYKRDYSQIFGQQVESQQKSIAAIASIDQDAHKVSNARQITGTVMSGVQGFMAGYSMGGMFAGSAIAGGGTAAAGGSAVSTGANATVGSSAMSYSPAQSTVLGGSGSQLSTSYLSYR